MKNYKWACVTGQTIRRCLMWIIIRNWGSWLQKSAVIMFSWWGTLISRDWIGTSRLAQWILGATTEESLFYDCLEENICTQHVRVPTRENNILDLIISSEPDLISNVSTINCLANGDHNMLLCNVHMKATTRNTNRHCYDYNKAYFDSLREDLAWIDWDLLLNGDVRTCWNKFKELITSLEEKYVPKKRIKSNSRKAI